MPDLTSARLIVAKGLLFLLTGLLASAVLLLQSLTWPTVLLLVVAIWSFCRFYYFAFYVLQHYVDGNYRYRGLFDAVQYLWNRRRRGSEDSDSNVQPP
ncbi:MAG: hypothetical protein Fues2KO_27300 [Fuerstiella sp.]